MNKKEAADQHHSCCIFYVMKVGGGTSKICQRGTVALCRRWRVVSVFGLLF